MIIITSKIFKNIDDNNYIKKIFKDINDSNYIKKIFKNIDDNNYIKKYSKTSMIIITSKNIQKHR